MEANETTGRKGPRYATLGTAGALVGALTYIGLRDPHTPSFGFPLCPFRLLTGWYCPGCGGLRMTHDLLHGDVSAAIVDNAFMLVGLPMLALWLILRWRGGRTLMPKPAVAAVVVAVLTWTLVRNLPGFPLVPTLSGG
ncbi:DUF2752 domain-containing protein [Mycolicibacterium sp.]|uniref:DUF2752 domain-containing protein n=1 Tax=Mycolicibacterium sp. TaxID=2320850 RepID=UPI001A27BC39|nr:DUF2752 domain-containing protein [Mycolicibacterium sp.]MBJ7340836.1 DUF2752 domain-containing protein [Mycolicibacterium sp.]